MDRRSFLQTAALAAAASAATTTTAVAAEGSGALPASASSNRDWSNRSPKGEPVVKRFDEQRWVRPAR